MRRPSPSIVIATIAVVAGLTGTGIAATSGDGVGKVKYVKGPKNSDSSGVVSSKAICPIAGRIIHQLAPRGTATRDKCC